MSFNIGFVILNYSNFAATIECVESVLALDGDYPIIVVDNYSPNDSYNVLKQRFDCIERITLMLSGRNGGYSAGNNVGIRALRGRGICNVVIATSDTRVESQDLVERCLAARDAGIAVVGPYVRGDEPGSANPILTRLTLQYIAAIHLGKFWELAKKVAMATLVKPRPTHVLGTALLRFATDVYMVHGCFLFLSEHYLSVFAELDEDLFMYGEEDLIAFNCARQKLRIVYDPHMCVYHGDAKSTQGGDFRRRALAASMKTLRKKMILGALFNAYYKNR